MSDDDFPALPEVLAVARWAGLPCDEARAVRLRPFLVAQKKRMRRLYDEDVTSLEFDFLMPRERKQWPMSSSTTSPSPAPDD